MAEPCQQESNQLDLDNDCKEDRGVVISHDSICQQLETCHLNMPDDDDNNITVMLTTVDTAKTADRREPGNEPSSILQAKVSQKGIEGNEPSSILQAKVSQKGIEDIDWSMPYSGQFNQNDSADMSEESRLSNISDKVKSESYGDRHLVVVFTNEYKPAYDCTGKKNPYYLPGVEKDRKRLYKTFGGEKFDLLKLEDSSSSKMKEMMQEAVTTFKNSEQQYKSVFIIFSGHGGMEDYGDNTGLHSYIVAEGPIEALNLEKFFDSFDEGIGNNVPKFFLIDACRKVVKRVPPKPKGDDDDDVIPINSFYAFATKNDKYALTVQSGSYWLQTVAKHLLKSGKNRTVVQVIIEANKETEKFACSEKDSARQQVPFYKNELSTEGEHLCLDLDYESATNNQCNDQGIIKSISRPTEMIQELITITPTDVMTSNNDEKKTESFVDLPTTKPAN